jgi:hypothetical protein
VARIVKYLLASVGLAVVVVAAVVAGREAGLLAGALVPLAALIGLTLYTRTRMDRAEKAGMADWEQVLAADASDDAFFSDWTATMPHAHGAGPALSDAGVDGGPEVEVGGSAPEGGAASPPLRPVFADDDGYASTGTGSFPFDDDDGFGDLPPLHLEHDDALGPLVDAPSVDDGGAEGDEAHLNVTPEGGTEVVLPAAGPSAVPSAPAVRSPDAEPAPLPEEVYSFAGAAPAADGTARRSVIDWTGPARIVEDEVRTSDDILAASAATALPTVTEDQPAPVAGSELARLLAKVEARLRDYD